MSTSVLEEGSLTVAGDPGGIAARTAVARGRVVLGRETVALIQAGDIGKGDVLVHAKVAGVLAAKQASHLIPSCQGVLLAGIDLDFEIEMEAEAIEIRAYAKTLGLTGVGMEALTAVTVAALTVVDMCKSHARDATITDVQIVAKTGGQSGTYRRSD